MRFIEDHPFAGLAVVAFAAVVALWIRSFIV